MASCRLWRIVVKNRPYCSSFRTHQPSYLSGKLSPTFLRQARFLPPGYQTVVTDGITYYLYDGVYYQPYLYGGQTVYMVVPTQ